MTQQKENSMPRKKPWLKLAFIGSLAVNLAVVGMVAGAFMRDDGIRDRRTPGLGAYALPYMKALSGPDRRAVISAIRQGQPDRSADRQERRKLYTDVLDQLRADPFDVVALRGAIDAQAGKTMKIQLLAQSAWVDIVANMSAQERKSYAQSVEDNLKSRAKPRD